jgi:hypothetical protein
MGSVHLLKDSQLDKKEQKFNSLQKSLLKQMNVGKVDEKRIATHMLIKKESN